jgi:hypothetical protein
MIVWLASYPRSGNTLLRTVFKQTMDLSSRTDSLDENGHGDDPSGVWTRLVGVEPIKSDWQTFYQQASESDTVYLVKTHHHPIDAQPAIYVVRDGRKACLSYLHFHRSFRDGGSLAGIVSGLSECGDWSSHYRAWSQRARTMVVRYEDLLNPTENTLTMLASAVGYAGAIASWTNPFEELQKSDRKFFREGEVAWKGAPEWTPIIDALFFHLHRDLMAELGYIEAADAGSVVPLPDEFRQLIEGVRALSLRSLALHRRNDMLQAVCDERLDLINHLTQQCELRNQAYLAADQRARESSEFLALQNLGKAEKRGMRMRRLLRFFKKIRAQARISP